MITCTSANALLETSAESTTRLVDEVGVARVDGLPLPFFPCPDTVVALVLPLPLLVAGGGESGLRQAKPVAQLTVAWSMWSTAAKAGVTCRVMSEG